MLSGEWDAEPIAAADRAGITAFQVVMPFLPARLLSLVFGEVSYVMSLFPWLTGTGRLSPNDAVNIASPEFKANPYPFYAGCVPKRRSTA